MRPRQRPSKPQFSVRALSAAYFFSMRALISSARQADTRADSLTGFGKRPSLTPSNHVERLTGISGSMPRFLLPMIWGRRRSVCTTDLKRVKSSLFTLARLGSTPRSRIRGHVPISSAKAARRIKVQRSRDYLKLLDLDRQGLREQKSAHSRIRDVRFTNRSLR